MEIKNWEILVDQDERLDRVLRKHFNYPWLSRSAWEKVLEEGWVFVAGKREKKAGREVKKGDVIRLELPSLGLGGGKALAPIWVDQGRGWMAFSKPCGWPTYPLLPWERDTLAHGVVAYLEQNKLLSEAGFLALAEPPIMEGGLLQRLDTDTSGLVLCALNADAKKAGRDLFSQKIKKEYLALTASSVGFQEGDVSLSYSFPPGQKKAICGKDGAPISLTIRVLAQTPKGKLLHVSTLQGVRHIVRVALATLSLPLYGDKLYGGNEGAPFHQLHAFALQFPRGERITASVPQSFVDCSKDLGLEYSYEGGASSL